MNLPDIKKAELEGKRVLVRVDFNLEIMDGKLGEKYRIAAAKQTVDFILSKPGVKLALLSHLGEGVSFEKFYGQIGEVLKREVIFVGDCVGEKVGQALSGLKDGQVLMLENVRFHPEEENSDVGFAKKLAENFDLYVNEAFGVSHRDHASLTKIAQFLSVCTGFNLQKEIKELSKLRIGFERPAVALIGGAKIETKLPVVNFFAANYNNVLIGGKIGMEAEKTGVKFLENVITPKDYLGDGSDVGPRTIDLFSGLVDKAKTIVWNGPLGQFEKKEFAVGTEAVVRAVIANRIAYKVAGGGETIQFLEERDLIKDFDFVSTGGGAMLEFLVKGTLPAMEALKI